MNYETIQSIYLEHKSGKSDKDIQSRYLLATNVLNAIIVIYDSMSKYHNGLYQELQEEIKRLKSKRKVLEPNVKSIEEPFKVVREEQKNELSYEEYKALEHKYEKLEEKMMQMKSNYLQKIRILEHSEKLLESIPEWIIRIFNS